MTVDPRSPESSHDASSAMPRPPLRRYSGKIAGLGYQLEQCPDGGARDHAVACAGGGGLGLLATMLLGASLPGKLIGTALGAGADAMLARWHMRLDWDPDALRATLKAVPFLGKTLSTDNQQAV